MATVPPRSTKRIQYPTSDGKPMAETEVHRDDMMDLIRTLDAHFADRPDVCVSGNMLMFYVEGDKRKHVSPDVFVTFGVPRRRRDNYLIWEEGKAPDLVIELTSKTTRREDLNKKFGLYRDVMAVREYVLFDPKGDYLKPPLRGFRLAGDEYVPVEFENGRLPSEVLGLHFEREGQELRLYDPASRRRLRTQAESLAEARAAQTLAEAEAERLRREVEELRRRLLSP